MKGMFLDDSMSNLTSASNEASLSSSSNKNEVSTMYPPPQQQSLASVPINSNIQIQTNKKKRNLPGNPDPEAEVISMSPKSLMATNRFVCEICNKGFQRDQNLQLHRRGHNLPWKLKQRSKLEVVRKKVYVCPEPSCVHHEPARALGDLTGIKKHFSRKHGEKKWKCEKCSKRYAVQSDWKAHSKICGTREYRCDCGTLFSRRDSFITHRAFCGALAGENARSSSSSSLLLSSSNHLPLHLPINNFPLKTEPPQLQILQQHPQLNPNTLQQNHQLPSWFVHHHHHQQQNPNNNVNASDDNQFHHHLPSPSSPPHMSATALLQKAAQMGVAMSKPAASASTNPAIVMSLHQQHQSILSGPHPHDHMCAPPTVLTGQHHHHHHHASGIGNLSSSDVHHDDEHQGMMMGGGGFANVINNNSGCFDQSGAITTAAMNNAHSQFLQTGFQDAFFPQASMSGDQTAMNRSKGSGKDELTRDFLGLTGFPPPTVDHHFLSMTGLDQLSTSSPYQHQHHHHQQQHQQEQNNQNQNQNQLPWEG